MRSLRILVADDDQAVRNVLRRHLSRFGHRVETAANGVETLDLFMRRPFGIVIADLHMPEMGGIELVRGLKKISLETPVIVLTGHAGCLESGRLRGAGASAVLRKPVSIEALVGVIGDAVSGAGRGIGTPEAAADAGAWDWSEMKVLEHWRKA